MMIRSLLHRLVSTLLTFPLDLVSHKSIGVTPRQRDSHQVLTASELIQDLNSGSFMDKVLYFNILIFIYFSFIYFFGYYPDVIISVLSLLVLFRVTS